MEEVFIEPGYYYIAQKILQNLDDAQQNQQTFFESVLPFFD